MLKKITILSFLLFCVLAIFAQSPKSPHGVKFKIDCTTCHTTEGWNKMNEKGFNHNKTKFPLAGQHKMVGCKKCHPSLQFNDAKTECSSCHADIHQGTVGRDCGRCHNSHSWIIPNANVKQIHRQQGFVLLGAHATADCNRCHTSASKLRFDNMRTDCYACHQFNYQSAKRPNHKTVGFGTDCERCHNMAGREWTAKGRGFVHSSSFPLTGAHKAAECRTCHWDNYSAAEKEDLAKSNQCNSCHSLKNSDKARFPAHTTKYLKYDCGDCHNTTSWSSGVRFTQHDSWGRIYSGKHKGKWTKCTDCHNNDAAYVANCSKCHSFSSGKLP
ncbi:MAG: cytochrome c3 family protein [Paludibacter sp.]|nr:cytochrome c3 family protein [Paludibacter sp.]